MAVYKNEEEMEMTIKAVLCKCDYGQIRYYFTAEKPKTKFRISFIEGYIKQDIIKKIESKNISLILEDAHDNYCVYSFFETINYNPNDKLKEFDTIMEQIKIKYPTLSEEKQAEIALKLTN